MASLGLMAGPAEAGLMGNVQLLCDGGNITCANPPDILGQDPAPTAISDNSVEFGAYVTDGSGTTIDGQRVLDIDVSMDGTISFTNILGQDIFVYGPSFRFELTDLERYITDFSFADVPNESNTDGVNLAFGNTYAEVSFTGNPRIRLNNGSTLSTTAEIPAPATLALLGMGLIGIGAARRLRR